MTRPRLPILVLAVAVLAACSADQTAVEKQPPAAAPAAGPSSQLAALLPAKDEVPGWGQSKAPRSFTPDNLWELINGAADGFVTYGVQEVATADYAQAGSGYEAVIEVYRMKDPLNAYGKYSEERNPEARFVEVGNEGYAGGTAVNFWTGPYYVKIATYQEKGTVEQELVKLGQAVARKVTAPGAEPRELAYFPKENQLPRTTLYIPKDVLAQSYFGNGFETRYKAGGGKDYKLVLIGMESPEAARDALARYREYVAKNGKDVKDLAAPGEGGFTGTDGFYGSLSAVRAGKHIVVSLGAPTEDAGRKQLGEIVRNIR